LPRCCCPDESPTPVGVDAGDTHGCRNLLEGGVSGTSSSFLARLCISPGGTLDLFDPAMAALHVAYLDGGIVFGAATLCWLVGIAGRQVVVWLGRSVDAALVDLLSGMFVSTVQSR
jgi:hypothetical protein